MKKLILVLMFTIPLSARYHKVTSSQEFKTLVDKYEHCVACFAPASKLGGEDLDSDELKGRKKYFKSLQEMLQSAASKPDFKRFLSKDIGFIAVDAASKRVQDLVKDYHVAQTPVCYAFQEGAQDKEHKIIDPTSTNDVINLLDMSAGDDVEKLLAERKEQQNQEQQERIARYYAYGGFYPYGWGYGWGGSSYWARPYWGWGCCW